ncbi:VRR-NUC domain-containing protein [Aeromonas hydrophila]|uniref:VRR-NUC domain-containing protein n=1 Tax=Aeromonas hydrophila TaxID=644 RepID=UPI00080B659A|nr:VRR-NUC domain-containing protein [Aeromonas hydrophila]
MPRFDDDFLQDQVARRQGWASKGIRAGSGRSFSLPHAPDSMPIKRKPAKKTVPGAKLGDPGYVSPHAVAMAALAKNPELRKGNQEYYEQVDLFARVEVMDPELYSLMSAVPNGGYRPGKTAGMMKASGQKDGYPDVIVDLPCGVYHGCRMELKAVGGRISDNQVLKLRMLSGLGYYCALVEGVDEAIDVLMKYRRLLPGESMVPWSRNSAWQMKETE